MVFEGTHGATPMTLPADRTARGAAGPVSVATGAENTRGCLTLTRASSYTAPGCVPLPRPPVGRQQLDPGVGVVTAGGEVERGFAKTLEQGAVRNAAATGARFGSLPACRLAGQVARSN